MYVIVILSSMCLGTGPLCLRAVTPLHYLTVEQCSADARALRLRTPNPPYARWNVFCAPENLAIPFTPYQNDPTWRGKP